VLMRDARGWRSFARNRLGSPQLSMQTSEGCDENDDLSQAAGSEGATKALSGLCRVGQVSS
jgi:hypothetical protein